MTDTTTILYIEDDRVNRLLVRKLLKATGYNVIEAENGLLGIDMAKSELPDLILMDMNMPGIDGYEATTILKSIPNLTNTPIVALTANVTEGDKERSLISGCDGYISKPIDVEIFLNEIKSYLEGKREIIDKADESKYLKEYRGKLVLRLEDKVRELTDNNRSLELRVEEKVEELQSTQNMLLQSEKMASIGQLAAGVAHEINNPVGFISSNITTLKNNISVLLEVINKYESIENYLDEGKLNMIKAFKNDMDVDYIKDDINDLIDESLDGVERVKKIVKDLKDFSHVDESEWQVVNLHHGLDSTLNMVNNELKYKAEIIKQYGDIPDIECIPSQLNQVFMNLFVNAAHAIEDKGVITIETKAINDEFVEVKITDTGKGIDKEHIKRIFEPFFTTKPVGKGTGLGLSVSYGIIQKHNGEIHLHSEVGKGTTFTIRLPVDQGKNL